jgi:hypothetical protein
VLRTAEVFDAAWSFSPGPGATRSVRRMLDDVARTEAATRALRTA